MTTDRAAGQPGLEIFHFRDSVELGESGIMHYQAMSDLQQQGALDMIEAGAGAGAESRVLVNLPGFSLVHVWFKRDYPLPLHSHDSDCLYHVVAGELLLGRERLGPGDSFMLRAGTPYTYRAGPEGVEVLEIRHDNSFDFVNYARDSGFYRRAVQTVLDNLDDWRQAERPSGAGG